MLVINLLKIKNSTLVLPYDKDAILKTRITINPAVKPNIILRGACIKSK
jgi:hypothetical protein